MIFKNEQAAAENQVPPSYDISSEGQSPVVVSDSKHQSAEPEPEPSSNTPSGSAPRPSALPPPTNLLRVFQHDGSVRGTWAVDPTLAIPESLLAPLPDGETERLNLHLEAHNGSINAKVHLISGKVDAGPTTSRIKVKSQNGNIALKIHRASENQRFKLNVTDENGNVQIYIPKDFRGPIFYQTHNGSTNFASSIESQLTVFSADNKTLCRSFLGDWQTAGFGDDTKGPWAGDEIHVEAKNGYVTFKWADLSDEAAGSWIKKIFSWSG